MATVSSFLTESFLGEKLDQKEKEDSLDETMHLFVYGNIKIVDKETGEVLVNKPF